MSAPNILSFRGGPVPASEVAAEAHRVIRSLEEALAAARTGRYFAVGIVMLGGNGDHEIDTRRDWRSGPKAPPTRLVSGLQLLICDIGNDSA